MGSVNDPPNAKTLYKIQNARGVNNMGMKSFKGGKRFPHNCKTVFISRSDGLWIGEGEWEDYYWGKRKKERMNERKKEEERKKERVRCFISRGTTLVWMRVRIDVLGFVFSA